MADYYTRSLQAKDPRFKRALDGLGYGTRHMEAQASKASEDELTEVRAEYAEKMGKKPYHGWDVATLREKMAEAKDEGED